MTSLRRRLFVILVAATGLIWLCGILWICIGAKTELEHVLDTRLQEAAKMVNSLLSRGGAAVAGTAGRPAGPGNYEHQLSCQIWSLTGQLLARSGSAPEISLTDRASGFSDRTIGGEAWRVYAIENAAKGVRVMIGDRLGQRDQLVADLVKGLIIPGLLILPGLGGLIWLSLGRGLRPVIEMAATLKGRSAEDMRPLDAHTPPAELRPLVDALNGLFVKVETARRHERDVTAFAAHELRTPLAGLKTQAQIALAAVDPAMRHEALQQILLSVDRTTRLVRQLLALAKLDAGVETDLEEAVSVGQVLDDVIQALQPATVGIRVTVDPGLRDFLIRSHREMLTIALRNLHENALQHSPPGGTVSWRLAPRGDAALVEDDGPGIAAEELPLLCQRFFRGASRSATGCGLGLAIVEAVARRTGATLVLKNREGQHGLRAMLLFPPSRTP